MLKFLKEVLFHIQLILPSEVRTNDIHILYIQCIIIADFSAYVSSLPPPAHDYLKLQLDWGHGEVEKDLHQIADKMLKWEEKLSAHLGLTPVDISDIKERNPSKPELRR